MSAELEKRIIELSRHFDTEQVARIVGRAESFVYNVLAQNKGATERKPSARKIASFLRPKWEIEDLLTA